ncbi:MAG: class I SAM-dependent methyltransferase [Methanosarcinales archaeon]|nr:MAG: class I SAM-dependent methyltransferase [Methanosarcinales archaeon]
MTIKLNELLDIQESIILMESGYQNNTYITKSLRFLYNTISELSRFNELVDAKIIMLEEMDRVYALGLYNPPTKQPAFWTLLTTVLDTEHQNTFNEFVHAIKKHIAEGGVSTLHIERSEFIEAMREYYSIKLVETLKNCPVNFEFVYNEPRVERLKIIINQLEQSYSLDLSGSVLEICCGNGMATAALSKLGIRPLCIDNDSYSILEGLVSKVLKPEKTIVADVTELTDIIKGEEFDASIGFMLGDIDEFNKPLWKEILIQTIKLTKKGGSLLFTFRTEPEVMFVKDLLEELATGDVICQSETESLYDCWIYIGKKKLV